MSMINPQVSRAFSAAVPMSEMSPVVWAACNAAETAGVSVTLKAAREIPLDILSTNQHEAGAHLLETGLVGGVFSGPRSSVKSAQKVLAELMPIKAHNDFLLGL